MSEKSPLTLTITLSLATLLGYGAYRIFYLPDGPQGPKDTIGTTGARAIALPNALPEFELKDLDGQSVSIGQWSGEPMIINFWATWCAPCLREIPLLKQYQDAEPDVRVVGIAVDRPGPVSDFSAEMKFNYPILIGQSEAMAAATAFGVDVFVLPFTVFTTTSGATLGIHAGELHREHLDAYTETLAAIDGGRLDLAGARARLAGLR
jgi:thiol-disulfide isomerase/thioredoxin